MTRPRGSCLGHGLTLYVRVALGGSGRLGAPSLPGMGFPSSEKIRNSLQGAVPASHYFLPPRGAPCVHWVVGGAFWLMSGRREGLRWIPASQRAHTGGGYNSSLAMAGLPVWDTWRFVVGIIIRRTLVAGACDIHAPGTHLGLAPGKRPRAPARSCLAPCRVWGLGR